MLDSLSRAKCSLLTAVAAVLLVVPAHALSAAGVFSAKGKALAGVAAFADAIKGNMVWGVSVFAGLMVVFIGWLFLTGHSRAQDHAVRTITGFIVICAAGGIVS